jgi:hypothetical protein
MLDKAENIEVCTEVRNVLRERDVIKKYTVLETGIRTSKNDAKMGNI